MEVEKAQSLKQLFVHSEATPVPETNIEFDSRSHTSSEKKLLKKDRFESVKETHLKEIFDDLSEAQEYMKKYESFLLRMHKAGHLQKILAWRDINYNAIHTDLHKHFVQIVTYFMQFHGEDTIPSWLLPPIRKKKHCRTFLAMIEEAKQNVIESEKVGTKRKRIDEAIVID